MLLANSENNYKYNPKLQPLASKLRKTMTKSEACLWKYALKAKKTGYTFNRQRPVLNFIADFLCKELLIIIEADGASHLKEEIQLKDLKRQALLEDAGYKVIRFTNTEILTQMEAVRRSIQIVIEERAKELKKAPPAPSERGK